MGSPHQTLKLYNRWCTCFCPALCPSGSSDLDPTETLAGWHKVYGRFCVLGRNDLCSSHVAVTLALSATAEEAGGGPKLASGRGTLSVGGLCCPSSEVPQTGQHACPPRVETRPDLAVSLPRNSVHLLFWSVGDLFTHRSRFLLPTNFILQEWRKKKCDVCLALGSNLLVGRVGCQGCA